MLVFISGGVRSGKSTYGEILAGELSKGRKIYLATSEPYDEEMLERIRKHRLQRQGKGFLTMEKNKGVGETAGVINSGDTVLLDCLGNLLANEMFGDTVAGDSPVERIFNDICSISDKADNLIIISNDVFSDGCCYSGSVMEYIDGLAELHRRIVGISDMAIECVFGNRITHKSS